MLEKVECVKKNSCAVVGCYHREPHYPTGLFRNGSGWVYCRACPGSFCSNGQGQLSFELLRGVK